jgi:hypothetical protein
MNNWIPRYHLNMNSKGRNMKDNGKWKVKELNIYINLRGEISKKAV